MKIFCSILAIAWCFTQTSCNPNTGHSISTNDTLDAVDSEDWTATWVLEAPKVTRRIENRVTDAFLHYSMESGSWQTIPFLVTRINDTKAKLTANIDSDKLVGHSQIKCFIEYNFDGNRGRIGDHAEPRTVQIQKKVNKSE